MPRTRWRPLPSHRITPNSALWFGIALSVLGFVELWLGANLLTAILGAFTLASYLFVYTPLKQVRRIPRPSELFLERCLR